MFSECYQSSESTTAFCPAYGKKGLSGLYCSCARFPTSSFSN